MIFALVIAAFFRCLCPWSRNSLSQHLRDFVRGGGKDCCCGSWFQGGCFFLMVCTVRLCGSLRSTSPQCLRGPHEAEHKRPFCDGFGTTPRSVVRAAVGNLRLLSQAANRLQFGLSKELWPKIAYARVRKRQNQVPLQAHLVAEPSDDRGCCHAGGSSSIRS